MTIPKKIDTLGMMIIYQISLRKGDKIQCRTHYTHRVRMITYCCSTYTQRQAESSALDHRLRSSRVDTNVL